MHQHLLLCSTGRPRLKWDSLCVSPCPEKEGKEGKEGNDQLPMTQSQKVLGWSQIWRSNHQFLVYRSLWGWCLKSGFTLLTNNRPYLFWPYQPEKHIQYPAQTVLKGFNEHIHLLIWAQVMFFPHWKWIVQPRLLNLARYFVLPRDLPSVQLLPLRRHLHQRICLAEPVVATVCRKFGTTSGTDHSLQIVELSLQKCCYWETFWNPRTCL